MLGVILVVALIAILAYAVYSLVQSIRERNRTIEHRFNLPWPPEAATAHVAGEVSNLMGRWGFRLRSQGPAGIVYTREYRSAWLLIPCIFLFPIGLLSLLIKSHTDISFTAAPEQDGSSAVTVVGRGSRYVRDQIGVILAELSEAQPATT
jgi:hypothetical protein